MAPDQCPKSDGRSPKPDGRSSPPSAPGRPKIVVANRIHGPVRALLEGAGEVIANGGMDPWPRAQLASRCQDADALMAFMTETIDREFLSACPSLKIVAGALKGYNNIDVEACTERRVTVTIVPDLLTEPTAELTIGLMIALARNIGPGDGQVRGGGFRGWRPQFYGGSINGATVGVLGAGAVGRTVLKMLTGFSCRTVYTDKRALPPQDEAVLNTKRVSLDQLLAGADFVVLALHLLPETQHLVDDGFLSRMKPGGYLINPARGSLVDEAAVSRALETGHLAGYAADTFEMEDWARGDRPSQVHPALAASPKTVLTPHIGSAVTSVREAIERSAAESILAVLAGGVPETAVNAVPLADVSQKPSGEKV